ncbi:MAG: DUF2971 domain-containing protein [Acidobacteriia bacterium]|nr:DUF2971 domain-containing protein [Terriglobia bacterium]
MGKRVYKFLKAEHGRSSLKNRRLKVSTIDDLNDPFDLCSIDTTDPRIEAAVEELIRSFKGRTGLLCFSRNWDNLLLWSHYGASHTGVCLGFNIPDDQPDRGFDMDVRYQPNLLRVGCPEDVNYDLANRLLRTKHECWSYEQEVRMFVSLKDPPDENGLSWFNFGRDLILKEVIVGAQCEPSDNRALTDILEVYGNTVECTWSSMRKDAFLLVRLNSPPSWFS